MRALWLVVSGIGGFLVMTSENVWVELVAVALIATGTTAYCTAKFW